MDHAFIHKVKQTILEHIEDEKFGVNNLASEIGFSKSQIWRKVKASTGKSVNQFIREIRLQEAAKLIKEDQYTASEISFQVGFSSPSYFNKCFHDYFDVTPGEYKNKLETSLLSETKEESENTETNDSNLIVGKIKRIQEKSSKNKKFLIPSLLILLILAFSFYFYSDKTDDITLFKKKPDKKSIAVLPFKDMSSEDRQWFSDGITDNILSKLAQIKDLTVISRTSSDTYKNSDKKVPRIAKELGVAYILEGSVTIHDNEVKINTQLVNANDKHLWSNEYLVSFDNIFSIQNNVAKHVAEQLQINLTTEEEMSLTSFPTKNLEAYKNYIKARSFAEKGTKEDFKLSIELFQQAIDLDPDFADAYAEMALAYIYNNYLDMNNWNQNLNKTRLLIDKALLIDPNSSKAYSAKGMLNKIMLSAYESKSDKAQENFEKAIELNPNNALAHRDIANLYCRTGNMDKSISHINMAAELDPLSSHINKLKISILLYFGKIKEAEALYKNKRLLFSNQNRIDIENNFIISKVIATSLEKKDWSESIKYLQEAISKGPQNSYLYRVLGDLYDIILNDDMKFLEYAQMAYQLDSTNWYNTVSYFSAVIEGKKFKEGEKLMNNYKHVMSDDQELIGYYYYYYHKENYDDALKILNDSLMKHQYGYRAAVLAQKGDFEDVQQILNRNVLGNYEKARVFAILKERDSMYYYLEKEKNYTYFDHVFNGLKEADPYRKEERYKAYLKKNYLPIPH